MDSSKKILYLKIVIGLICVIFIIFIFNVIVSINNDIKSNIEVNETTVEEKQEIIFDMTLPPSKQKNLKGHVREYMSQVYDYLFHDIKWKNIQDPYPYDYSQLKKKENLKNFYELLKSYQYSPLVCLLFKFEEDVEIFNEMYLEYPLNMDDIPVTNNYKEKHPKSLFEEFDFIKKEGYKTKKYKSKDTDLTYWYEFSYVYTVGADESDKIIGVLERKYVAKVVVEDGVESVRPVYNKEGNEVPAYIDTRKFYFNYTTDEKGYVDDVVYDRTETITADKYLDNLIRY